MSINEEFKNKYSLSIVYKKDKAPKIEILQQIATEEQAFEYLCIISNNEIERENSDIAIFVIYKEDKELGRIYVKNIRK
jgi:hypothetical protein